MQRTSRQGRAHHAERRFRDQPYSFQTRFQSEDGKAGTNPEELLGAAHAGCYAMALAFALSGAGHAPEEQLGGYFFIDVPDLDAALAWAARCPAAGHGVVEVRPLWQPPPDR
jgi:hypothetical protein